ncbi:MAG: HU family DNA-binding protein [Prevotella sp.]|nr:HU family DNA-binding protein [Prevotella sp.]
MGTQELVVKVSRDTGIPKETCRRVIDTMVDEAITGLSKGENVRIKGLVNLEPAIRSARLTRDLNSGEIVTIPEIKTIKCKVSRQVKDIINGRSN